MGYESKLYIVNKSDIYDDGMKYGQVIATFDLCKVGSVARKIAKYPNTDAYIYADDGNTRITKDLYGEPFKEIPIADMIEILERESEADPYRRYRPCIQLLKGFDASEWKDLVVLHYGH